MYWLLFIVSTYFLIRIFWNQLIENAARIYCMWKTRNYDPSHDWLHHQRVVGFVKRIAYSKKMDPYPTLLLVVAAWVHDIVDHKYIPDPGDRLKALAFINAYLSWFLPKQDVARISIWITGTSWSKEKKNGGLQVPDEEQDMARVLADADRLDSISGLPSPIPGMTLGIYRCREYSKHANPNASNEEIIQLVKKHIDEKLGVLHKWIHNEEAKHIANIYTEQIMTWYRSH
jgi:uncharacterized protein